jgi:hypothetical protein
MSLKVLDKDVMDEDIDDEDEAPEIDEEEEEEGLAEAICLVAITKDTQTEVGRPSCLACPCLYLPVRSRWFAAPVHRVPNGSVRHTGEIVPPPTP